MDSVFLKVLNLGLTVSWLILAVILARFLLKKAPKWVHCLLWGLVAFRLVCPFPLESAFSLLPSNEVVPESIVRTEKPQITSGISILDDAVNPVMERTFAPDPGDSVNPMQVVVFVAGMIWGIGLTGMLLYAGGSFLMLRKKVGVSVPIADGIRSCDEVESPFILGVFCPLIYVPSNMSGDTLEFVIAHERAHIRRLDHWWKPLGFLLLSVYWFQPLCWVAYILLCRDIEAACDEKVIADKDREYVAGYSEALLRCSVQRKAIAACPLAFGETGVKARIKGVLNYKKPAFWVILLAVVICVIVAICFMATPWNGFSKNADRINQIKVFDGSHGHELIITEQEKIEKIVAYLNDMKLKRGKISLGYMGYHFHVTLEPKRGTWDDFIVNGDALLRNDPFFYEITNRSGLEAYLIGLFEEEWKDEVGDSGEADEDGQEGAGVDLTDNGEGQADAGNLPAGATDGRNDVGGENGVTGDASEGADGETVPNLAELPIYVCADADWPVIISVGRQDAGQVTLSTDIKKHYEELAKDASWAEYAEERLHVVNNAKGTVIGRAVKDPERGPDSTEWDVHPSYRAYYTILGEDDRDFHGELTVHYWRDEKNQVQVVDASFETNLKEISQEF